MSTDNPARLLALETTTLTGSVAAFQGGDLLAEVELDSQQRSAQSLAPGIKELLGRVDWQAADVQLIALPIGPGSFTGLRVGVTTAKMLAYAVQADVIGVNTLQVIASQSPDDVGELWAVLDAHRRQLFAARFVRGRTGWFQPVGETAIIDDEQWLGSLQSGDVVTGLGLRKLGDRLPDGVGALDRSIWAPMAAAVGRVGWHDYQAGHRDDVWTLVPKYYRKSAAEEKLERQGGEARGKGLEARD